MARALAAALALCAAALHAQPLPDPATLLERTAVQLLRAGRPADAAEAARAAVAARPPGSDALLRARALSTLGEIERDLDRFDVARAALDESLALRRAALPGDDARLADAWQKLAVLELSLGRPALAAEHGRRALRVLEAAQRPAAERAALLVDLAGALTADARLAEAEAALARAEPLLAEAGGVRADWLQRRGELRLRRGDARGAQADRDEALALRRAQPAANPLDLAAAHAAAADAHLVAGRYDQALAAQREADRLLREVRGARHTDIARSEAALAEMQRAAGDLDAALRGHALALEMRRERLPAEHPDIARSRNALGLTLLEAGRAEAARAEFEQALAIQGERPALRLERAATLHNLAAAALQHGDAAAAEAGFARAAAAWRAADAPERYVALSLGQRAEALDRLGRFEAALPLHEQAVATLLAAGGDAPLELALAFSRLAEHHAACRELPQAIFFGKESVRQLHGLRQRWERADAGLQRSFLRQRQDVYQRLAARLVAAGRLAEAEQVLQSLKEGELRELVRGAEGGGAGATVEFVGAESRAAQEGEVLRGEVRSAREAEELAREQLDAERMDRVLALKRALTGRFQRWVSAVREALARQPQPVPDASAAASVDERVGALQRALKADPGAVAVHYVVTEQQLAILVVTSYGRFGRFVEVPREQLHARIAELRQAIRNRGNVLPAAQALHRWLIAPIEHDLEQAQARTLVLSLTGSLRYLPFAALHDGQRYLVERMPLATWAAAGATQPPAAPGGWQVAAMGASQGGAGFAPLPAVPAELRSIVGDEGQGGILPGRMLLDAQFDRAAMLQALRRYNVAHIASHFEFRPGDETRSVLLLGDGRTLSLGDIAELPFDNVQVLALSACNTASGGGVNENGIEVEGLAAAVQDKGARSVLASLWSVADASTARLMASFYAEREQGLARALREAQLRLLHGEGQGAAADAAERGVRTSGAAPSAAAGWSHPFYWAPFVLSGQWR